MNQLKEIDELKRRSVTGFGVMLRRQVAVKVLFVAGNVLLARILAPQVFGAYAIIAFALQFFSSFADVGLGAALIQSKNEPTNQELSTTFWIQQGLVTFIFLAIFAVAPYVQYIYPTLPSESKWVMRSMAIGFFFTSLKTIPMILMEKKLDFRKIALIEITEQVVFYTCAVMFALTGFQIWSFVFATIVREIAGAVMTYTLVTWRPSCTFQPEAISRLVTFGIPFQLTNFLNFIKEGVTPLFVGYFSGAIGVGYVTWARTFAFVPMVFSESYGRVAFPAYSAIQYNRELLRDAVEKSVRMMTFVLFPITMLMAAFAPEIIRIFFTEKWLPGLGAFYLFSAAPLLIGLTLPMSSVILSLGKSGILLKMSVLLVLLEWGLGVPFVMIFGYTGIALNQPLIHGIYFFLYRHILKKEGIRPLLAENIWRQFLAALMATATIRMIAILLPINIFTIPLLTLAGLILFLYLMNWIGNKLLMEFKSHIVTVFFRT